MRIKIRKVNPDGHIRLESGGIVREVLINEDILHPKKESVSVCFRGKNSSGIIDFSPQEIEEIYRSLQGRMHLIKGMKRVVADKGSLI